MTANPTRRRFLTIAAVAAALPHAARAKAPLHRWRGTALGAEAQIALAGVSGAEAGRIARRVEREIARLEDIFSLYRPGSALMRLNRAGALDAPPPELVEVLSLSNALNTVTGGAFDPTVQPLWQLHARAAAEGRRARADEIAAARALTGWAGVSLSSARIALAGEGMALTLNGIAQGYITDRLAALLRVEGLRDVLIDAGEVAALGRRPDGSPWQAGIADTGGAVLRRVRLSERALATSAPMGTVLDPAGRVGHVIDPSTGAPGAAAALVSVSAGTAVLADGLSTALCLMPADAWAEALARFPDARLELAV